MNTIPPADIAFFELMNEVVQDEPAGSTDVELMGQLAAIGIVKGKPFEPDERMRAILDDAAAVGNAPRGRFSSTRGNRKSSPTTTDSAWFNMLFAGGYTFRDAAAAGHRRRDQAVPRHRRPQAALADLVLLRRHRDHPRDVHAADRIGSQYLMRPRTPTGIASTAPRATG